MMILSEFAGAAQSLNGSIVVNPWDSQQVENAIHEAVTMGDETRKENHRKLFKVGLISLRVFDTTGYSRNHSTVRHEVFLVLLGDLVRQRDGKDQCRRLLELHQRAFDHRDYRTEIRIENFKGFQGRKWNPHRHWKHQQPSPGSKSSCGVSRGMGLLDGHGQPKCRRGSVWEVAVRHLRTFSSQLGFNSIMRSVSIHSPSLWPASFFVPVFFHFLTYSISIHYTYNPSL